MKAQERSKKIIQTSIIGISLNILLSVAKAIIGYITNSIAIVMDSVNNLSDALSSIITIVGTKLANKKPDEEHPYGHGRIEYLSSLVISVLIIYAGFTALVESVKSIFSHELPDYNAASLVIVALAVLVKVFLGFYYRKVGKKVNSDNLINSGTDALLDVVISITTLVSAIIFILFKISLEPYLATIISLIIIRSGFNMIKETTSIILGRRIDSELAFKIKRIVNSFDEVLGCYDLILNNYGPENYIGSFHIEVNENLSAVDIDILTRRITKKVYKKTGVIVSAVGIYSMNLNDKKAMAIRNTIEEILSEYPEVLSMHGFYVNHEEKTINIDIVISFDSTNMHESFKCVVNKIKDTFNDYKIYAVMDSDVSD